jgi:hypothetical protein
MVPVKASAVAVKADTKALLLVTKASLLFPWVPSRPQLAGTYSLCG